MNKIVFLHVINFIFCICLNIDDKRKLDELEGIWKLYNCPTVPLRYFDNFNIYLNLNKSRTESRVASYNLTIDKFNGKSELLVVKDEDCGLNDKYSKTLKNDPLFSTNKTIKYDNKIIQIVLNELSVKSFVHLTDLRAIREHFNSNNNKLPANKFRNYIQQIWFNRFYNRLSTYWLSDNSINYMFKVFKTIDHKIVKTPLIKIIKEDNDIDYKVHLGENRFAYELKKHKTFNQFINLYKKYGIKTLESVQVNRYNVCLKLDILKRKSCVKTFYLKCSDNNENGYFYINNIEKYCDIEEIGLKTLNNERLFRKEKKRVINKDDNLYKQVINELKNNAYVGLSVIKKINGSLFNIDDNFTREQLKSIIYTHISEELKYCWINTHKLLKTDKFNNVKWFRIYKLNDEKDTLVKTRMFKTYLDNQSEIQNEIINVGGNATNSAKKISEDSGEIEMVDADGLCYKAKSTTSFNTDIIYWSLSLLILVIFVIFITRKTRNKYYQSII